LLIYTKIISIPSIISPTLTYFYQLIILLSGKEILLPSKSPGGAPHSERAVFGTYLPKFI
jgi:hypothetical protein